MTMLSDLSTVSRLADKSVTRTLRALAHSSSACSTSVAARSARSTFVALSYLVAFLAKNTLSFLGYAGIDATLHGRSGESLVRSSRLAPLARTNVGSIRALGVNLACSLSTDGERLVRS